MKYYKKLQSLIGFRGTKKQIAEKISNIAEDRPTELSKAENPLPENDMSFQFSLGMDGDDYLDFDIYLLKTRARCQNSNKRIFMITEINQSY